MVMSISDVCFSEECLSDVFAQVLWSTWLPSLSSWLHLNNYVSRGLCFQVITMTYEFVPHAQCFQKWLEMLQLVLIVFFKHWQTFPVPLYRWCLYLDCWVGWAGSPMSSSDLSSLRWYRFCLRDGVIVMGLVSSQIPCIKGLDKPCNFKTLHHQF